MATALVTGANRGIGLELCQQLTARGDDVIAVCRSRSAALDALGARIVDGVDVSLTEGIAHLRDALDGQSIDLLVNNAGILIPDNLNNLDFDNLTEQFRVNSLGPLRVTHALLGNLRPGAKVAIITSRMGSIADNAESAAKPSCRPFASATAVSPTKPWRGPRSPEAPCKKSAGAPSVCVSMTSRMAPT